MSYKRTRMCTDDRENGHVSVPIIEKKKKVYIQITDWTDDMTMNDTKTKVYDHCKIETLTSEHYIHKHTHLILQTIQIIHSDH